MISNSEPCNLFSFLLWDHKGNQITVDLQAATEIAQKDHSLKDESVVFYNMVMRGSYNVHLHRLASGTDLKFSH